MEQIEQKSIEELTGYVGNLTAEQAQCLEKIKDHVHNKLNVQNPRFDDQYFLRFCRARNFDFDKVRIMFEECLKWRKEQDVDNVCSLEFPKIKEVFPYYPHGYFGTDKKGRPVYFEKYSNLNLKKMFALMNKEEFMKYYIQSYERVVHVIFKEASRARGKLVERTVTILDVKGLGLMDVSSNKEFLKLATKIAQDYYPEMMAKMFIINAGFSFKAIWSIVKVFLDKKTTDKVSLLGSDYKKALLEWIDEDQLPVAYGGTCQKEIGDAVGPWADKMKASFEQKTLFLE